MTNTTTTAEVAIKHLNNHFIWNNSTKFLKLSPINITPIAPSIVVIINTTVYLRSLVYQPIVKNTITWQSTNSKQVDHLCMNYQAHCCHANIHYSRKSHCVYYCEIL